MLYIFFYVYFNWPGDLKHLSSAGQQADKYIAPGGKFGIFFMYLVVPIGTRWESGVEGIVPYFLIHGTMDGIWETDGWSRILSTKQDVYILTFHINHLMTKIQEMLSSDDKFWNVVT